MSNKSHFIKANRLRKRKSRLNYMDIVKRERKKSRAYSMIFAICWFSFVLIFRIHFNLFCFSFFPLIERWFVHFNIASASRWSTERRIAMRTMESNTKCSNDSTVSHFTAERTEHIFTCKRWCVRHVSQMARFSRERQWISEYNKVNKTLNIRLWTRIEMICAFD